MNNTEKLAKLMHDAWREKKINELGWHTAPHCPTLATNDVNEWGKDMDPQKTGKICPDCHPCVAPWEDLTDAEKELPLMNAEIAVNFMNDYCPFYELFPAMPEVENGPATPERKHCHISGREVGCGGSAYTEICDIFNYFTVLNQGRDNIDK